jgi:hypothetical protein
MDVMLTAETRKIGGGALRSACCACAGKMSSGANQSMIFTINWMKVK